jgi:predicted dehydrogenase
MIKASEDAGKMLFMAQNQRLAPAHIKAREILQSGMLGKVITFKSTFGHPAASTGRPKRKRRGFSKKT